MVDYDEAIALCDEATTLCNTLLEEGVSVEGEMFVGNVSERIESMQDWIETNTQCTEKQFQALQNMIHGLKEWQRG